MSGLNGLNMMSVAQQLERETETDPLRKIDHIHKSKTKQNEDLQIYERKGTFGQFDDEYYYSTGYLSVCPCMMIIFFILIVILV